MTNKRGIRLVSKLVLIMEMCLINHMAAALEKAGTRSKAQGGARSGISTMDPVVAITNVIAQAKRRGLDFYLGEYNLYKFFDMIPGRAFLDAFTFFSFDEHEIRLVRLFWEGFTASARTKYGRTNRFPVGVGNIQGLGGSPFS